MLILHFIGLAMGLGTSFAHAFLGKTIAKLELIEATKFRRQIMALSQMGYVGTLLLLLSGYTGAVLLLVSGIYLIIPYWPTIMSLPLLIIKLVLFLLLLVLIFLINKAAIQNLKNDTNDNLKQIAIMGKLDLLISIVIIILAVTIFH